MGGIYEVIKKYHSSYPNIELPPKMDRKELMESFDNIKKALESIEEGNEKLGGQDIEKDAKKGSPLALHWMGISWKIGLFTFIDTRISLDSFIEAAVCALLLEDDLGKATFNACMCEVLFEIATLLEEIRGASRERYLLIYKESAEMGSYEAAIRMGDIYRSKTKYYDKKKANKYYKLAYERRQQMKKDHMMEQYIPFTTKNID